MLKELKEINISKEGISSPLIKIKYFIQNIEKFDEKDKNLFEKEKFYSWPLKMVYATYLAISKIRPDDEKKNENEKILKEAIGYYEEVIENLKDFQNDIQNQTILFLFIFKTLSKNKNLDENKTTKIEAQNKRKK